ncbi:hypothetical protein [Microbacterium lacticum]|uniref:hypothetical protein n=1 Tax=Microbacterium lacticum TaxID=33885 RepID=UPI0028D442A8|nr:hypothetical protein [Microbacterium lacticum]
MDFLAASRDEAAAMRPDWDMHETDAFDGPTRLLGVVAGLNDTAPEAVEFFRHECPQNSGIAIVAVPSRAVGTWSEHVRS